MGGFLPYHKSSTNRIRKQVSGLSRGLVGWETTKVYDAGMPAEFGFPSPLEGWVGSYNSMKNIAYAFAAFVSGP